MIPLAGAAAAAAAMGVRVFARGALAASVRMSAALVCRRLLSRTAFSMLSRAGVLSWRGVGARRGGMALFARDLPGFNTEIHIQKDDFNGMLHELSRSLMGTPYTIKDVVRGEAASVLQKASERTKPANRTLITRRYTIKPVMRRAKGGGNASFRGAVANAARKIRGQGTRKGSSGRNFKSTQDPKLVSFVHVNGKKYYTRMRYSDAVFWGIVKPRVDELLVQSRSRRSSDKGAWLHMAKDAGLSLARFSNVLPMMSSLSAQWRTFFESMYGKVLNNQIDQYAIEVHSHQQSVLNPEARGIWALKYSMEGRVSYFQQNMKHGVMKHASAIAKRYPNIVVSP